MERNSGVTFEQRVRLKVVAAGRADVMQRENRAAARIEIPEAPGCAGQFASSPQRMTVRRNKIRVGSKAEKGVIAPALSRKVAGRQAWKAISSSSRQAPSEQMIAVAIWVVLGGLAWRELRGSFVSCDQKQVRCDTQPIVTAAILVIGDEILSGRTKDKNIGYIAEYLTNIGIDLREVRVVSDEEGRYRRRAQRAASPLHLCLHHRRHRPDP